MQKRTAKRAADLVTDNATLEYLMAKMSEANDPDLPEVSRILDRLNSFHDRWLAFAHGEISVEQTPLPNEAYDCRLEGQMKIVGSLAKYDAEYYRRWYKRVPRHGRAALAMQVAHRMADAKRASEAAAAAYVPTPEAAAADDMARALILQTVDTLPPSDRANGERLAAAITRSSAMQSAYRDAVASGDKELVSALAFGTAGFLNSFMKRNRRTRSAVIANVTAEQSGPAGEWSSAILEAMRQAGAV